MSRNPVHDVQEDSLSTSHPVSGTHDSIKKEFCETGLTASRPSISRSAARAVSALLALVITALIAFAMPSTASAVSASWQLQTGRATDIGVGANGDTWIIGNNPVPGGFGVYHLVNGAWVSVPGGGVRIAVAPNGQPWIVNNAGQVFWRSGSSWILTSGSARDIAVDVNGNVYAISTVPRAGGYAIYRYIAGDNGWVDMGGGALRIAAGQTLWVVNDNQRVFRRDSGVWVALPGTATDVGASRGDAWIIGTTRVAGGFTVHEFDGVDWDRVSGGAVAISVAPGGQPWLVNSFGEIFRGTVALGQLKCSIDEADVPEASNSVVGGTLLPGESVQVSSVAAAKIWAGVALTGWNGPEGWTNLASSSFPLPSARAFSLLINDGSGWRYLGASTIRLQNTTGTSQQLRFRVNDDVPNNGDGYFEVRIAHPCRT